MRTMQIHQDEDTGKHSALNSFMRNKSRHYKEKNR